MLKRIIYILIFIAIFVLCVFVYKTCSRNEKEEIIVTHNMLVKQIVGLGKLEVVRYNIQDLMDFEKKRNWLPNSVTSVKVVGEVTACIDLTQIKSEDIRVDKDSVCIILPDPEICNWKIDHSKSKVYNVKYGLWETEKLVDEAYKEAEDKLYKEAQNMGIDKNSRENSKKVLTPILKGLGFKKIRIEFASDENNGVENQTIKLKKE